MNSEIFINRPNLIKKICDLLESSGLIVVTGSRGVGKTTIIQQYIGQYGGIYSSTLKLSYHDISKIDNHFIECEENSLLVIDDILDYDFIVKMKHIYLDILKGKNVRTIIVTSYQIMKNENRRKSHIPFPIFVIPNFSNREARLFINKFSASNKINIKSPELNSILKYVDNNPRSIKLSLNLLESISYEKLILNLYYNSVILNKPIEIYLDTSDRNLISKSYGQIIEAFKLFGFEIEKEYPEILGSWFKQLNLRISSFLKSDLAKETVDTAKYVAELKYISVTQSQVDLNYSQVFKNLAEATKDCDSAALRFGAFLFVKTTIGDKPNFVMKILSIHEMIELDNKPSWIKNPYTILDNLDNFKSIG